MIRNGTLSLSAVITRDASTRTPEPAYVPETAFVGLPALTNGVDLAFVGIAGVCLMARLGLRHAW